MIVQDLIKAGMRKAGVLSYGETPESSRLTDGLQALQLMLRNWASKRIRVFASAKESFNLVSSKYIYTWGPGGDITTTRPHQILGAFVKDSGGTDHPIDVIPEGWYRGISLKTITGRPQFLFYHPLYPVAAIYLHPIPNLTETMWVDSLKPFTEISSFATLADTIAFPPNYEEALIYNLAIRIAPEYGVSLSAETVGIAKSSYNDLVSLNSSNQVEAVNLSQLMPTVEGVRPTYNIYSG